MTDLDRELADRLGRLAAAVPVREGRLDPVHAGAVAARQQVRMAWLTPLVALLVLLFVAAVVGFGSSNRGNGPISSTTRVGDFELTIRSAKARYEINEPIEIVASLTYSGSAASISIAHAHGSPMAFGMLEPVHTLLLGPFWLDSRETTTLERGVPLESHFRKSFGSLTEVSQEAMDFYREPTLVLPTGTWHPYVVAEFEPEGAEASNVSMRAELAIDVGTEGPTADAAGPSASPTSVGDRWRSTATQGDFELELAAAREQFRSSEPLDVVATLTYRGSEENVRIGYLTWGPIEFGMAGAGAVLSGRGRWTCDEVELRRGEPMTEALADLETSQSFAVPHGLHTVSATASFSVGGCSAPMVSFDTSIVVAVSDGPDDIPLLTDESDGTCTGLLLINGGTLIRTDSGLGVVNGAGERRDVVWPPRYSASQTTDGAVLFGSNGEPIAHEGEQVRFDAGTPPEGPLRPCGPVERVGLASIPGSSAAPTGAAQIRLATAGPPSADGLNLCATALGGGILARNPRTGMGFRLPAMNGAPLIDVVWPHGFTAWLENGIAVLRDADGEPVAREGDSVMTGGGISSDGRWFACSWMGVTSSTKLTP